VPPNLDMLRSLGDLEGTVRQMSEQWRRQEDAATAGRALLHSKFEEISIQMGKVASDCLATIHMVEELKKDMDEKIMPTIEAYKIIVARSEGALLAGKTFWSLVVCASTVLGFLFHQIIAYFGHTPTGH
jgi:hypothetical protein